MYVCIYNMQIIFITYTGFIETIYVFYILYNIYILSIIYIILKV